MTQLLVCVYNYTAKIGTRRCAIHVRACVISGMCVGAAGISTAVGAAVVIAVGLLPLPIASQPTLGARSLTSTCLKMQQTWYATLPSLSS